MFQFVRRLSFQTKLLAGIVGLACTLMVIGGFLIERQVVASLLSFQTSLILRENASRADTAKEVMETAHGDLETLLGVPPLQGLVRARANDGVDPVSGETAAEWQERVEEIFVSMSASKGLYDQIRYIDASGQEIVRVNFNDGLPSVVEASLLQNKARRSYFSETMALPREGVYISPIDLNREGESDAVELPHKPVLRLAVPVFSDDGQRQGILVMNVLANHVIDALSHTLDNVELTMVVDRDGFFLLHPDESRRWGAPRDLGTRVTLQQEYPAEALTLLGAREGSLMQESGLLSFRRADLLADHPDSFLVVLRFTPRSVLTEATEQLRSALLVTGIAIAAILFVALVLLASRITAPLQELAKEAERLGRGDKVRILPVSSNDEIGTLRQAFNTMSRRVEEARETLEQNIAEKTKALSDSLVRTEAQNLELENAKRASVNILEDVEEEKHKTESLARELEKFKLAVDSASDHVVITDAQGIVLYANAAVEQITGYSQQEVVGKKAGGRDLWGGQMDDAFYNEMWKTIAVEKSVFAGEVTNRRKSGEQYVALASISPVIGKSGEVDFYVGIERDITKEKQIDKAKSEFVSLASHQLRTPLSSINWYTEMLLAGDAGKISKKQKKYLEEIYTGNHRMTELVSALLNVSRIDLGTFMVEPKPIDVSEVLESVIGEQAFKIKEKKQRLTTTIGKRMPKMNVDSKLLRIVFQNLLSNAVKYTPEKGVIDVALNLCKQGKTIDRCELGEDSLCFTVQDTGYGIPKEQQKKIFTKLFRADNVREMETDGTGLGLYIVKSIVEHAHGSVWFTSEKDKGSTFYVVLPKTGMLPRNGDKAIE